MSFVVTRLRASPLSVPLAEPFVIASGRVDVTRAALVEVTVASAGATARGLGEAATLVPVTWEDQPEVLAAVDAARSIEGSSFEGLGDVGEALDAAFPRSKVARAGVEAAVLDAIARLCGVSVRELIGGDLGRATRVFETDITLPIQPAASMATLAASWRARGFTSFKVKVGRDVDADVEAIAAVHARVPDASFRVDANEGFSADVAIAFVLRLEGLGVVLECFEQPCAAADLEGMAAVTRAVASPVVADESVKSLGDLARVVAAKAATGVNLKLVKSGGLVSALAIGRAARAQGLAIMCGGMVETRLGMTAAAHVAAALGGVEFVDLDTAWLLAADPFVGGYVADGPRYELVDEPGFGVAARG